MAEFLPQWGLRAVAEPGDEPVARRLSMRRDQAHAFSHTGETGILSRPAPILWIDVIAIIDGFSTLHPFDSFTSQVIGEHANGVLSCRN
jgi:hypothetical protein